MEVDLFKRLTEVSLEIGRKRELISQWLHYNSLSVHEVAHYSSKTAHLSSL